MAHIARWPVQDLGLMEVSEVQFTREMPTTDPRLFSIMADMFSVIRPGAIEVVNMKLNSHVLGAGDVFDALRCIDPLIFEWRSPDPDHQISVSIVCGAVVALTTAIRLHWKRIRKLTLTNMDCSHIDGFLPLFAAFVPEMHVNLTHLHIGQSVFVKPRDVVLALLNMPNLCELTLADVYLLSIWGRRLRVEDLQEAIRDVIRGNLARAGSGYSAEKEEESWTKVLSKVKCLVERQRLDGGDRGTDMLSVN
ncbi:hypothetical protein FRB99_004105 [Tulasnella sp. 403]|nr:hypothetical protein FRB99_004105 [Tulasnella sp. 403]